MFEAFQVAVRVSLINGVSAGLMNMSRAFAKTHGDAQKLQRQLNEIKFLAIGGGVLAGSGLFGLHLLGKTMPYAKEYTRQLALMNTLGMKQADIARVVGDAWRTTYAVPTTTAAQNLATFRELRSAFGSDSEGQGHASAMLPVVGRLQGVMQSLTGKPAEHVGFDMVKAIELRTGVMTTEALKRNSELMSQAIIGMGGTVTVQDFHGALKMGRASTMKWDDDFTYNYLPTLMQEMKTSGGSGGGGGAQSAGRVVNAMHSQMFRMTKAAMPLWIEGGLVNRSDVVKNATGQFQVRPGSVKDQALFDANPFLWVKTDLAPAIDKIMKAHKGMTAESAITGMYSNQIAAFGASNMYFKVAQYERDKATISKADGGYAAYNKLLKTDPTLAGQALAAQWQNILAQIGFSIMPMLVSGTLKVVKALTGLSKWMHENPGAVTVLTTAFAGLSVALVFSGTVLMLTAAFKAMQLAFTVFRVAALLPTIATMAAALAPIAVALAPAILCIAALTAIGVALYEIAKHWDTSKGIIANIKAEFGMFFSWILGKVSGLLGFFGIDTGSSKAPDHGPHGRPPTHSTAIGKPDGMAARRDPFHHGSPFVATAANHNLTIVTKTYLKDREIAHAVNQVNARDMNRAATGGSTMDPRASLPQAAGATR